MAIPGDCKSPALWASLVRVQLGAQSNKLLYQQVLLFVFFCLHDKIHAMKPQTSILQTFKILILALIISIGVSYISAASWAPAPCNPPNCNVDAPINVGSSPQFKTGSLGIKLTHLPTAELEVGGTGFFNTVMTNGFGLVDGKQAIGKVLVSDENGLGNWGIAGGSNGTTPCTFKNGKVLGMTKDTSKAVTFNTPFPSEITPNVVATGNGVSTVPNVWVSNISNTGFSIQAQADTDAQYIAIACY